MSDGPTARGGGARTGGYRATRELERRLEREREVSLTGARYAATVAKAGRTYEAWTDSLPFVYGRPSRTLQGALDSLKQLVIAGERLE